MHEIERRLNLVRIIGGSEQGRHMEMFLTSQERKIIESFLKGHSFPVGIHPGAKNRFKQWAPSHFAALGRRLQREYGAQIFVTGSREEASLAQSIADAIPHAISVAGKFSVRLTATLIEQFKLFLTNDTGPMHMAYAVGTPTFSPFVSTNSALCGPYEVPSAAWIQKLPTCHPCLHKKCRLPFCFEQISEVEAWSSIKELIKDHVK